MNRPHRTRWRLAALMIGLGMVAVACGGDDDSATSTEAPAESAAPSTAPATTAAAETTAAPDTTAAPETTAAADTTAAPVEIAVPSEEATLRLGYFPNITHGAALVGVSEGLFAERLGPNVTLETSTFNAGPAAVEALLSGALDATFIGPNPAINAFAKTEGELIRIVAGEASGGAYLVVRDGIESPADLAGTTIATPQLGNTQDVALRTWLAEQGFETSLEGGGDVSVLPQENAQTLDTFIAGTIDGAWVPEPWATRLIQEGGGKVLLDERDLWPDGQYVTTHLVVRTEYLAEHPDVVRALVAGLVDSVSFVNANPAEAQIIANAQIEAITEKALKPELIEAAWPNITFTWDPIASSLQTSATNAQSAGLLDPVELKGIYSLDLLNEVLAALGEEPVADAGLGA